MPRLDGTGPNGDGPMTGCKRGNCTNIGRRQRRNIDCPRRRCYEDTKENLLLQKEELQKEIKTIDKKLDNF